MHGSGANRLFWLQSGMDYLTDPANVADEQQTLTSTTRSEVRRACQRDLNT